MHSNYSHINIGVIGSDKPVDQWHVDSVDYVLIVVNNCELASYNPLLGPI